MPTARTNREEITATCRTLLLQLGVDLEAPGMEATPRRMAAMYDELIDPDMADSEPFDFTTFPNDGYDNMVVERNIPVYTFCEHHMLPFVGKATVAYIPDKTVVGLSKLARLVAHLCRRPQVQERLTSDIADRLVTRLNPHGVGVVIEAEHLCMTMRGAKVPGATTITSALRGSIKSDPQVRAEFLALAGK